MTARTYTAAEMRGGYLEGYDDGHKAPNVRGDAERYALTRWPDQTPKRPTRQEVIEKAAAVEAKAYYHTEWALLDEPAKAACRERIVEILAVVEAAASVEAAPPEPPAMTVREVLLRHDSPCWRTSRPTPCGCRTGGPAPSPGRRSREQQS